MKRYDERSARCFVFTFKDGLLSPVAHDLRLVVTSFEVEVDDEVGSVVASFDTASLRVDTPMKDGAENRSALSASDKHKIAEQIREDVLHAKRYPRCFFRSRSSSRRSDGGYDIVGELTLHGVHQLITTQSALVDGAQQLELSLHQPDYGIVPFKAMLGTLKIRPNVVVRLVLGAA